MRRDKPFAFPVLLWRMVIARDAIIERTPEELRKLHDEARGRIGALADVVGGHCTQPGFALPVCVRWLPDRATIHIPSFPRCPDCGAEAHELTFRPVVCHPQFHALEAVPRYD